MQLRIGAGTTRLLLSMSTSSCKVRSLGQRSRVSEKCHCRVWALSSIVDISPCICTQVDRRSSFRWAVWTMQNPVHQVQALP